MAPRLQDGHASDVPVGEQASGADREAIVIMSENVCAFGIDAIPFEVERHALLDHEHGLANLSKLRAVSAPVCSPDVKWCGHHTDYIHAAAEIAAAPSYAQSLE
jgi:hypothetical protein